MLLLQPMLDDSDLRNADRERRQKYRHAGRGGKIAEPAIPQSNVAIHEIDALLVSPIGSGQEERIDRPEHGGGESDFALPWGSALTRDDPGSHGCQIERRPDAECPFRDGRIALADRQHKVVGAGDDSAGRLGKAQAVPEEAADEAAYDGYQCERQRRNDGSGAQDDIVMGKDGGAHGDLMLSGGPSGRRINATARRAASGRQRCAPGAGSCAESALLAQPPTL